MSLKRPGLDPADVPPRSSCGYPEPFYSRVMPRVYQQIDWSNGGGAGP